MPTDTSAGPVIDEAVLGAWLAGQVVGLAPREVGEQLRANALHFLAWTQRRIAEA